MHQATSIFERQDAIPGKMSDNGIDVAHIKAQQGYGYAI